MWLVICSPEDEAAIWAAAGLRARGMRPVEIVTLEAIVYAPVWEHVLARSGSASGSRVVTHDGRVLDARKLSGVVNRIGALPSAHLARAKQPDRGYAEQEWAALMLSWLDSLPNVVNPPHVRGLAGPWRMADEWRWMAAEAGLEVEAPGGFKAAAAPVEFRHLVVVGLDVFGHSKPPLPVANGCVVLARRNRTPLLGATFLVSDGAWRFIGATPLPDFRAGGGAAVAALGRTLQGG